MTDTLKNAAKHFRILRRKPHQKITSHNSIQLGLGLFLVLTVLSGVFYTRAYMPTRVYAAVPTTLNFQARLLNSGGAIVPDGNYSVAFKLYDAQSGGTNVWTETQGSVQVKSGYLSVYLGSVNTALSTLDWSQQYWLTMNVNGDGEMNPRLRLTSVPYAFQSGQADRLTNGAGSLTANDLAQLGPSSPQIVNLAIAALRINQTGAGALLQFQGDGADVFTVAKNGDTYVKGALDINGATVDIGSAAQAGGLVLHNGNAKTGTIQAGSLSANRTYTLPDADGTICLTTTCSGGGSVDAFEDGGNSFGAIAALGTIDNFALRLRTNNTDHLTLDTSGNLNFINGGLQFGGNTVLTNTRVLQNVFADTSILTSGLMGAARGGTGVDGSTAANGQLLIGNGTGFSLGTLVNNGGLIVTNGAGSLGLAVNYGSLANSAVQGNTTLICPSGTGNLSGGGGTITLGAGGTCGALDTAAAAAFGTSVTTPLLTNSGPLAISTTGVNDLTFTSGSGLLVLNANTIRRTAAGTLTFDLSDSADTVLDLSNSGAGSLNLVVEGSGMFGAGLTVSGGASITGDVAVNGGLIVGNTFTSTAGTIRWTGTDFQGYDGTQWVSLTSGGGGGGTTVIEAGAGITKVKGSDQTITNSTTLVNDSDLFFAIEANETRAFRFVIHATTATNANIQFSVVAPSGATCTVGMLSVSSGSGNVGCGISVTLGGTASDTVYEVTGTVMNGATAGNVQLQWAQGTGRNSSTTVYARSFVHTTSTTASIAALQHFAQGGNAFGATATIGTTDNFGLNLIANNTTVLNLATSGLATFSGGVTAGGLLTVSSGGANITGGFNNNSGGISNAGNILGVGSNITATAGLTIATSGAGSLTLNSASGLAVLGATTLRTADSLIIDLQKASNTALTLQNSGLGTVSLNLFDGGLQTAGTLRLTNSGALQNITGLTVVSGGASISGNITLGGSSSDRLTLNGHLLGASPLVFQGATDNTYTTTLSITDPTANNTITLPNASGTLLLDTRSVLTASGSGLIGGGNLSNDLNLQLDINSLTANSAVNQTDFLAIYDGNGVKKISRSDFLQGVIGALQYHGTWNASTNTPTLSDATGSAGDEYAVSVSGTQNLGSGNINFGAGDFIIHNGTKWEVAPSSSDVSSVFGRTGGIVAQNGDYNSLQITNTPAGSISATTVQAALNELDNEKLGNLNGLSVSSQSFANDTNVTITSSGSTHTLGWSGLLSVSRGGTGSSSFSSNGVLYGNGTSALQVTAAGTEGQILIADASGVPAFTSLTGDVVIDDSGVTTIGADRVALGADTTGSYIANLGALIGLSASGNSGEGSTPSLSVLYGSTVNTAVQGNTGLTVSAGTNLSGGGSITLGAGGTVTLNTVSNPTFSTSVTTPLLKSNAGLSITSGASNDITIDSSSGVLVIGSNDTTLQRVGAGTYTIDLNDAAATTLVLTNSDITGTSSLNIDEGNVLTAGTIRLTNAGALQNITTLSLSGAISGATATNTINGLIINSGALSGITTLTASGRINSTVGFAHNNVNGGTVTCSSNNFLGSQVVRGGIIISGTCENDDSGLSDARLKTNVIQVSSVLDQLKNVNVVNFNFKCDDPDYESLNLGCEDQTGVIAQELAQVFPGLVSLGEDGYYRVRQRSLQFYSLKAVGEISAKLSSNGDARLNNISTGGTLRLNSNGQLQNITGLNIVSGGATISGNVSVSNGIYQINGLSGASVNCTNNNLRGTFTGGIATSLSCAGLSDYRLKENVTSLDSSILDRISDVNAVSFDFKCNDPRYVQQNFDCSRQTGVIAQELAHVFPELVYQGEDGFYRVKYDALNIYTLKAVGELAKERGTASGNSGISTGGTLRLDNNGQLHNITGLNMVSGGASIAGGINNNSGGLANAGQISGATIINAQSISLNATTGSNMLNLTKDGQGVFTVFDSGALELKLSADAAFSVKNKDGKDHFSINTNGGLVNIGSSQSDERAVLLVLDSINMNGDPAGVNGAQYYNSASNKFRCHQNDKWQDCLSAASTNEYVLAAQIQTWQQPAGEEELPGEPRTWVDLSTARELRITARISAPGTDTSKCRFQYAPNDDGPWRDLSDQAHATLPLKSSGSLKTDWAAIRSEAKGEVLVRMVCTGGNYNDANSSGAVPKFSSIKLQIR